MAHFSRYRIFTLSLQRERFSNSITIIYAKKDTSDNRPSLCLRTVAGIVLSASHRAMDSQQPDVCLHTGVLALCRLFLQPLYHGAHVLPDAPQGDYSPYPDSCHNPDYMAHIAVSDGLSAQAGAPTPRKDCGKGKASSAGSVVPVCRNNHLQHGRGPAHRTYQADCAQPRLETEKKKAELALYKAQINPHFLFNTLNTLYGMIVMKSQQVETAFMQFIC